jgi:hypothetical protein
MEVPMSLFQWLTRGVLLLGAITTLRGGQAGAPDWFTPWAVAVATVALEKMRIPMFSTLYRVTMLLGLIALVAPAPASAQLGRLVKKAKEATGIEKPAAATTDGSPANGSQRGISVRSADQITKPVLVQFETALEAERILLAKQVAERKAMKTPEQYGQCYQTILMDNAEGRKLMAQFEKDSEGASDQAVMRAAQKLQEGLQRLTLEVCGVNPDQLPPLNGSDALAGREKHAAEAGNLERRKYALLKERIIPLCALDAADVRDGDLSIPGDGANFVYLASEVALVRPRCGTLMPALQAVS